MKPGAVIAKNAFYIAGALYLLLLFFFLETPVFWDMYGQVKTAAYFLDTHFQSLLPSGNGYSDNGHFPAYALYLAVCFKVFGFKLWVAHLSVLPFLLGVLFQLRRFALHFLSEVQGMWVLVLCFFHPAIITQALYFSQELAIVFFSLWLINSLIDSRSSRIALAAALLCLFNLRGISLCLVLLFFFVIIKKDKRAWYLLVGLCTWITWLIIHYAKTGWFFSGEEIKEFRGLATFPGMIKNLMLSFWKMIDLGSVFGWAAIWMISFKQKKISPPVIYLLLASLSTILVCVPFTNPISNRYFLLSYTLLLPAFVRVMGVIEKKMAIIASICFAIVLFSNNGVAYPNRYGNAWDCSLKSLAYFGVKNDLDKFLGEQRIDPADVEAGFQVYFNERFYLMNGKDREYSLLSDTEMPTKKYVIDSDICNNYNAEREKFLAEYYSPLKEFRSGAVYLRLYKKNLTPSREFYDHAILE